MTMVRADLLQRLVPQPATGPLEGLQPMTRRSAWAALLALNYPVTLTGRVVAGWANYGGLQLCTSEDNGTNPPTVSQVWPLISRSFIVCKQRIYITPGCLYRAVAVAYKSGMTNKLSGGSYATDRVYGYLNVSGVWTNPEGNTATSTRIMTPSGSKRLQTADAVEGGIAGEGIGLAASSAKWDDVDILGPTSLEPASIRSSLTELRRWNQPGTYVDLVVHGIGGVRPMQIIVLEVPFASAWHSAADDCDEPQPIGYTPASAVDSYIYPWTAMFEDVATSGEYRYPWTGTVQIGEVAEAYEQQLGPTLARWTALELPVGVTSTRSPITLVSATNVRITDQAVTAYDAANPGWSVGCGGYGSRFAHADHDQHCGNRAVIPVRMEVWGSVTAGQTGTVTLDTGSSWISCDVTSSSNARHASWGWIDCPRDPTEVSVLQDFGRTTGGTLTVEGWSLSYDPTRAA